VAIRAVLFDVDDTLFDYAGACRAGILAYLAELGLPADEAAFARWVALDRAAFPRFLAGELTFVGQRRHRVREMVAAPLTDAEADAWFAGYQAHFEAAWAPFPDVAPALDALAGLRLGVLSNNDSAYQRRKLGRLGLADRFDVIAGIDVAGAAKPDAQAFRAGCAALDVRPEQAAYVGDLPDVDAAGAAAAGLLGVWLDRPERGPTLPDPEPAPAGSPPTPVGSPPTPVGSPPSGVVRITSLTELPALLGVGAPQTELSG
jgi:putative hydrolase of the HAD superfamily